MNFDVSPNGFHKVAKRETNKAISNRYTFLIILNRYIFLDTLFQYQLW